MIDLHIHSTYSDGTDSVIDILKKAEALGLEYISITDHNTCSAYEELKKIDIKKYYSGKIIPGIELNTTVLGIPIEILGYNFDVGLMGEKLKDFYLPEEKRRHMEIELLHERYSRNGIIFPEGFTQNYSPDIYASEYFHRMFREDEANKKYVDDDAWNSSIAFYRKYMSNPDSIFFVDMREVLPSIESTIELIKGCKGKVFVPHIFIYGKNAKAILESLLKGHLIDGIECYYSTFSEEQTRGLLNLCNQQGLLVSGGSDYHGLNSHGVEMSIGTGNLHIEKSIVTRWGQAFCNEGKNADGVEPEN